MPSVRPDAIFLFVIFFKTFFNFKKQRINIRANLFTLSYKFSEPQKYLCFQLLLLFCQQMNVVDLFHPNKNTLGE